MTAAPEPIDPAHAAHTRWDVAVIGAGPAGALTARQLALTGASVLLVDKATFPRFKVCGCCLNAAALATLADCGLEALVRESGARGLTAFHLAAGGREATVQLPLGAALSRATFDHALVHEATRAGATFLPNCSARLSDVDENTRIIELRSGSATALLRASAVVAADGLAGPFLRDEPAFELKVRPNSRIGAGTALTTSSEFYRPGVIYMACGAGGYVGLVRLEDDRLNVAAALGPKYVRSAGGLYAAVHDLLANTRFPIPAEFDAAKWRGTPPLTCRRGPVAAERVFLVGDATGYVEPFTGEGMAWALASAVAATPIVARAARAWSPELTLEWQRLHASLFRRRRAQCRALTLLLRRPWLTRVGVAALSRMPWLARPYVRRINAAALA